MVKPLPPFPKSWRSENKPHSFDPGCGHGIVLKSLGYAIDELGIQDQAVLGFDIGCSLLAWDLFDVDAIQTHHGRVTPVMVGVKYANPKAIVIGYMGDGGGYAIGAQHLVNTAARNDKVTVILTNNSLYAMTGGQMAPTTIAGEITDTTPYGRKVEYQGEPFHGPEMIACINKKAYIARGTISNPIQLKFFIKKAIEHQIAGKGFAFVEAVSNCPVNWKTLAKETWERTQELEKVFKIGEIQAP